MKNALLGVVRSPYFWLAIFGLTLYSVAIYGAFVDDDLAQIVNENHIHQLSGIKWSFRVGEGFFRPLMFIYFTVCYHLFGLHPAGYHLIEVIFGISNVLLIYWLFSKLFNAKTALFLALIFLLAPLNVDAVAYLSHIQDVFFMFFGLLSIRLTSTKIREPVKVVLITVALLASLLSKETGVLFIPTLLVYAYYFVPKSFKSVILSETIVTSTYLGLRHFVPNDQVLAPLTTPISHLDLLHRIIQIPYLIAFYFLNFVYPHQLAISHISVVKQISITNFWLPLVSELVISVGVIALGRLILIKHKKYWKTYLLFVFWLVLGLAFHLQIRPIFDATVSNWWFYFGMVGLLGLLGCFISITHWEKARFKYILATIFLCWLVYLGWQNIERQENFLSEIYLIKHDTSANPSSYLLQNEYGSLLLNEGDYYRSQVPLNKSIALQQEDNPAYNYLGLSYYYQGNNVQASKYFQYAIRYYPSDSPGYENYSGLLVNSLNPLDGLEVINNGLNRFPNNVMLWQLKSMAYAKLDMNQDSAAAGAKATKLANQHHQKVMIDQQNGQPTKVTIN